MKLHKHAKQAVKQGFDHDIRIIDYFSELVIAAREEFYEDNKVTLDDFLTECFNKALDN